MCLGEEARVARERRVRRLDDDLAAQPLVLREVDGRHAAGADLVFDLVTIAEGGVQLGKLVHCFTVLRNGKPWVTGSRGGP